MSFFQPKTQQAFDAEKSIAKFSDRFAMPLLAVDKNFVVNFANAAMVEMIASHAESFGISGRVDAASLMGQTLAPVRDVITATAGRASSKLSKSIGTMTADVTIHAGLDKKGQVAGYVLEWQDIGVAQSNEGMIAAIDRAQAMIEFSLDGKIIGVNAAFLNTIGYAREEIVGHHHSMFVDPAHVQTSDYRAFWEKLGRGEFDSGRYLRYGKGGREIWLQANYSPIFDRNGKPYKVVKFASDITTQMQRSADLEGQIAAINKSQALIEFGLDGVILDANENFLKTLGYSLQEIKGQHHSMFVESSERQSPGYRAFWENLARGVYDAGRYKRIGKHGAEVWIQASYNPIQDYHGKPFKVVKYATDITSQIRAEELLKQAVQQTRDVVEAAEGSDLSQRIPMDGKTGEIELLCSGVNGLLDTMADVVRDISVSAREVANASGEVATATTDLSQRTEEQAASLEETSAAMDEISAAVKKNAENARHASDSAVATQEVANKGGEVVSHAVEAMARIEDSSRKIADIIGVIDEIARQTNLLALNAAVEAARAGDAGRGFAVVASEVRNLAQRSSQAAKDIKDLINNSTSQVRDGVSLVNQAGGQLKEIVDAIKQVAAIMSEIAHASNEQATGVDEVNKALTQMDEVTQQNSALVEENAATAKTLEQHAASMSTKVSGFRLAGGEMEHAVEPMRMAAGGGGGRMMASRPAPRPAAPAARPMVNRRGPVGTMQTALANAVSNDDWKEF